MGKFFKKLIRPALFALPPEAAHDFGIGVLRCALAAPVARRIAARRFRAEFPFGPVRAFGLDFGNPIGIAAGFDKNARAVDQLAAIGFGFVEAGTVTLRPQPGNDKPRLFRLPADLALINRFGFNNDGAQTVAARLLAAHRECVIGVNIGKNKDIPLDSAIADYVECLRTVFGVADYIAVNVSSPNTPDLRDLQRVESLETLLAELMAVNRELGPKPLLVKIAPDLGPEEIEAVAGVALDLGLAGIIATNTTTKRDGLRYDPNEAGGLSGAPLRDLSTEVVARIYRSTGGRLPIIGVGGVFTSADAFRKIAAGATLVQAYTGFVYGGPGFARSIVEGLAAILSEQGFVRYGEAIGSGNRRS